MSFDLKVCKKCGISKPLSEFSVCSTKGSEKVYYRAECKECRKEIIDSYNSEYYSNNADQIKISAAKYYNDHKETRKTQMKISSALWNERNKNKIKEKAVVRERNLRKNPVYRLRTNIGRSVREALNIQGSKKGWRSFFDYVDYSLDELKLHLEK